MTMPTQKQINAMTEDQRNALRLVALRELASRIQFVDSGSDFYEKMTTYLDGLPQNLLKIVADGDIKFVSMLARNRLKKG